MTDLLAKSAPPETLWEHTENCLAVFFSMRDAMGFLSEISGEADFFDHLRTYKKRTGSPPHPHFGGLYGETNTPGLLPVFA